MEILLAFVLEGFGGEGADAKKVRLLCFLTSGIIAERQRVGQI